MERQFDKKTSGKKLISVSLKAKNNGLRQQLHLLPSDTKLSCISNILLPVMLCTTLKPNSLVTFSGGIWV